MSDTSISPADAAASAPSLDSLQPASTATSVTVSPPIVLRFSHAMMSGLEMLVVLHEGTVTGAAMGGQMVSGPMMGASAMLHGQWGPDMMGAGWQAANGTFGMVFSFTTA